MQGYVDPEYFLTHKCTNKSDVYSLGIVFLELLTGMQPISHGRNIVREVLQSFYIPFPHVVSVEMNPRRVKHYLPKSKPSNLSKRSKFNTILSLSPPPRG